MKPKILYSILMLLALAVMLSACQKNALYTPSTPSNAPSPSDSVHNSPPPQISTQFFPHKTGDTWTYSVTDTIGEASIFVSGNPSLEGHSGTLRHPDSLISGRLKVTVVGTTKLVDGSEATIWQNRWPKDKILQWGHSIDSSFVVISADSIKQYSYSPSWDDTMSRNQRLTDLKLALGGTRSDLYILPLDTGKSWVAGGKVTVDSLETVTVPAGTFKDVYRIFADHGGFNGFSYSFVWFKPGVGVVQRVYLETALLQGPYLQLTQTWKLVSYHIK